MKNHFIFMMMVPFCILIAQQDHNKKDIFSHHGLEGSKWVHQVFPEFPDCIDTIFFDFDSQGYRYSCEHKWQDSTTYELVSDTVIVNIFSDDYHMYRTTTMELVTKYIMVLKGDNLVMLDILQRRGKEFRSIDRKYITQKFKRLK